MTNRSNLSLFKSILVLTGSALIFAACSGASSNSVVSDSVSDLGAPGVVATNFLEGSLTKEITTEDCTLSNGDETVCYRIEVTGSPVDAKIGPFCPETTSSSAEEAGIWLDGEKIYNADGQFILDLSTIYKDVKT